MRSARIFSILCVGLLTGLCGCYHYGYSPYGNPYSPGLPPGSYPAGPTTYPPGTMTPGPATPYVPYNGSPGTSPTPINPNGNPPIDWQPGGTQPSSPAPLYSPQPGEKPVPNPTDDNKPFGEAPAANATPYNAPANVTGSGIELQTIESGEATPSTTVAVNADPFEIPAKSVSNTTLTARTPNGGSRPNPYGHERNFAWLRGIVEYDPQDQRWMILYNANPDASDRYGGSFTLSDHPLLNKIKPGDVIVVDGQIDPNSLDQHGKPLYHVDKLELLKPKTGY